MQREEPPENHQTAGGKTACISGSLDGEAYMEAVKTIAGGVYYLPSADRFVPAEDKTSAAAAGITADPETARRNTMARRILDAHNTAGEEDGELRIRFDKLTSHDITYVGVIQTARASGLTKFPMPYVLTNCHNSLCAVGGTINEDDHMFGLSAAKKYGGVYVPPHLAVIHQYAREMLATCGGMILGSDSHTRYGALGTLAVGEGGPELVKQLLGQTWDIARPQVIAIHLTGSPVHGVGPQDVALAVIGAVFKTGFVKNKVVEFVGPGIRNLSNDFRIGVDVMTTETTCLSSIWETDEETEKWYEIHGRSGDYRKLTPGEPAYYDGIVEVDLSAVRPMIAMPFHPSNALPIDFVRENLADVLHETEERARKTFGSDVDVHLSDKIMDGKLHVDQGVIAGCAGGGFENLCAAADILAGGSTGNGAFSLDVYPASMPVYMELLRNGCMDKLIEAGAVVKTCFCGPCFGAGDTPANHAFSIRHSTRNFPNREGSKPQDGQIAFVGLMDARSIAATAANKGILTPATDLDAAIGTYSYHFDKTIYENRVFDSHGTAEPDTPLQLGPNIRDWPEMPALPENLVLKVVAEIHDPVTTTDELIPSGETSSYRSNPEKLASFALSRRVPEYVGRAKEVRAAAQALLAGNCGGEALPELKKVMPVIRGAFPAVEHGNFGVGTVIYAVKPGDGSAREQAASCQKVLGGWANIAKEYATKRYRSNLINWGMLPFLFPEDDLPFRELDWIFLPGIREAVKSAAPEIKAYAVRDGQLAPFTLTIGDLSDEDRRIILDGCLINYNRAGRK